MQDLVSVVIPTYNRKEVFRSVKSALNQTYEDIEVIVVDDHSETPAEERLAHIEDEKLTVLRHQQNENGASARNTGIDEAEGKYIAFLDDDDRWKPRKIEKQIEKMEENECGACYTWAESRYENKTEMLEAHEEGDITEDLLLMDVDGSFGSTLVADSDLVEKIDGFDERFERHQDWEFLLRLLKYTEIRCVKEPLLIRVRGGESTNTQKLVKAKKLFLSKYSSEIEQTGLIKSRKIYSKHYLEVAKTAIRNKDYKIGFGYYLHSLLKYPIQRPKELAKPPYYFSRQLTIGLNDG